MGTEIQTLEALTSLLQQQQQQHPAARGSTPLPFSSPSALGPSVLPHLTCCGVFSPVSVAQVLRLQAGERGGGRVDNRTTSKAYRRPRRSAPLAPKPRLGSLPGTGQGDGQDDGFDAPGGLGEGEGPPVDEGDPLSLLGVGDASDRDFVEEAVLGAISDFGLNKDQVGALRHVTSWMRGCPRDDSEADSRSQQPVRLTAQPGVGLDEPRVGAVDPVTGMQGPMPCGGVTGSPLETSVPTKAPVPPEPPVCLIHGPFGSGKSTLLVAIIKVLTELVGHFSLLECSLC